MTSTDHLTGTGRIAYQGEPGSNSHIICQRAYPDWQSVPCASFEDVFAAVSGGVAELAMIPIDNSIAGRVADIHHFLPTSDLHIIGEHFLPIQFQLLGIPGSSLETIKSVHSHVHALGQCRKIIRRYGLTPVISGDTAGSAREVAEAGDPTIASLATPLAAEIYGLVTLAADAEDEDHNTTRFVTLSREPVIAPAGNGPTVTSFIFNVRNLPAALYKALGGFATNGVNMTKLESYMVGGEFTATQFLAEVDGHPEDTPLRNALEELAFFTTDVKILGVYPADPYRRAAAAG
ncbi:prephenate dehydratase [Microlunatus panaciterrae]|uniref:Prephenate dehydratase n=1 Tax=Microlunatus panaciterrae TaxID=400768 RepID=A0ABS2RMR9_9ACTN|nr:prephenate dehydratase [Microlunatus panaciterrae]